MDTIKFYKVNEPYGYLSNFAPYPIFINNELWNTVEHYFQASKFENEAVKLKIKNLDSPMEAAIEGRNRNNTLRTDWEDIKNNIMQNALLSKFLQHPMLKKELILTGNSTLIEHTQNDNYWADGGDGGGKNMLGILLMEVRNQIKQHSDDPDLVLPPWIAFPSISQYDLFWRMGLGEDYLTQWAEYYQSSDQKKYRQLFIENKDWEDIFD